MIPGFEPGSCQTPPVVVPEPDKEPKEEEKTEPEQPKTEPKPTQSCTSIDTCLAAADAAVKGGKAEDGRQFYQKAARLGSSAANVRIAEMYDPDTWSAATSPEEKPNWDTAAYWYEEAERQNDRGGRIGAGRVLCKYAPDAFQQRRGLEFLRKALEGGAGEDVQALITECEGRIK